MAQDKIRQITTEDFSCKIRIDEGKHERVLAHADPGAGGEPAVTPLRDRQSRRCH